LHVKSQNCPTLVLTEASLLNNNYNNNIAKEDNVHHLVAKSCPFAGNL
jgi:hypothetical protein